MKVTVTNEAGYEQAMAGLAKSYNKPVENMPAIALRLCGKGHGHDKFLQTMIVWVEIQATRSCWQQLDTYRVGVSPAANSAQSESTMHTILRQPLIQSDFLSPIWPSLLKYLNFLIINEEFYRLKIHLPEGFLQARDLTLNYQSIRELILQRQYHRWPEWKVLVESFKGQLKYPEFLEV